MPTQKRGGLKGVCPTVQKSPDCTDVKSDFSIRHVLLPHLPFLNCLNFELTRLLLCIAATLIQYLNIYWTTWWIPRFNQPYGIDLKAIDYNLLTHIVLFLIAPCLYEFFKWIDRDSSFLWQRYLGNITAIIVLFLWLFFQIKVTLPLLLNGFLVWPRGAYLFLLIYTPMVYLAIYFRNEIYGLFWWCVTTMKRLKTGFTFKFLDSPRLFCNFTKKISLVKHFVSQIFYRKHTNLTNCRFPRQSVLFPVRYSTISVQSTSPEHTLELFNESLIFFTPCHHNRQLVPLQHNCQSTLHDASQIREEVDVLRQDFNSRFMDVLTGAFHATFYSTIVPVLFTRPLGRHYDTFWCLQHMIVVFIVAFLHYWQYLLPPVYLDILHRSALHLGSWDTYCPPSGSLQKQSWSQFQVYSKDVQVKYLRGYFRAVGNSNCAEPRNSTHTRFYYWFSSPLMLSNALYLVSLLIPLWQIVCLEWASEWYKLLGLIAMVGFSMINLYRLLRNKIILNSVYSNKSSLLECYGCPLLNSSTANSRATKLSSLKTSELHKSRLSNHQMSICSSCGGLARVLF